MKHFLRAFIIVLVAGTLFTCQAQKKTNANILAGCLDVKDIQLLNSLSFRFEQHLHWVYKANVNDAYKFFLRDVATMDLPTNLFNYPTFESDIQRLKESEFFKKVWIDSSQVDLEPDGIAAPITEASELNQPRNNNLIIFNSEGVYYTCLEENIANKAVIDFIASMKRGVDINPSLLAEELAKVLQKKDYKQEPIRLLIATSLYYYLGLMLVEEKK